MVAAAFVTGVLAIKRGAASKVVTASAVDPKRWLHKKKLIDLSYRSLLRYLDERQYVRRIPRPMPEPPDRELWEIHREAFALQLLVLLEDAGCEVFFGDEAGFEGDPRPRQKWVKRGARPTQAYQGSHLRQNVIRAQNLRAIYGAWDALKNVDKFYPNHRLGWAAIIAGKPESRRLMGDVILADQDFLKGVAYPDPAAMGSSAQWTPPGKSLA
jgi:hypothetical protein